MHNFCSMSYDRFSLHIESRSPITSSLFIRRIATSFIITVSLCVVCLFSVLSISNFETWTSWSAVHAQFSVVNVVESPDDIESIQLAWWGVPAISIVYILLSLMIGEEVRDTLKYVRNLLSRLGKSRCRNPIELPTQ